MDSTHPHTVLSKLNEQRSQGLFCDVTIVVEDVKFRAHRNILAACSGYFKNALTSSDTCSSSQVLELMDLRSEVFADILNFIYCSKVTSLHPNDTRGLVAAGRRLGIPFLERLTEEKQDECVASTDLCTDLGSKQTKKEVSRREETDSTRGPRITNAFSINEVSLGNNPFTSLVQTNEEQQLQDVGQLPSNFSTTSYINRSNEPNHTLFEHSYAVSTSTEGKESSQWDNNKVYKPSLQSKQLIYRNSGPLKKRHRLTGTLGRSLLSRPAELQTANLNKATPSLSIGDSEVPTTIMTPPSLLSEAETEKHMDMGLSVATDKMNRELEPPSLSPHTEDSVSIYSCDQCPEIFPNKALLTIHAEVHKEHFVSHLFCKFCSRKFIHLKRLHNHEQVCPSALRGSPKLDPRDISANDMYQDSEDMLDVESIDTQLPSMDLSNSFVSESDQLVQSEHRQIEKAVKPSVGQRRYNCSVCKRVYVTLSSLKRHENVHSWQRAYPCHYCNKVFALAEYRTKHEIWHTGERRYQCIFCLETFMTYYILKNHQKSFHGIDPNLSVKKKSANGGLKASVYPIKLYRLLPKKFRKRQYKTYSQIYTDHSERSDLSSLDNSSPFEENGLTSHTDTTSFPLTFMATTKIVSPVVPRICFNKPSDHDMDQSLNSESEMQRSNKDVENRDPSTDNCDSVFSVQPNSTFSVVFNNDPPITINSDNIGHDASFLNSMSTVKKLGELSVSAKRVEEMTKEILQSSAENPVCDKVVETYIAKPACQGPSLESNPMPLCQITVKIGDEAIIRRQIKGSKLFPRKKRKTRKASGEQSPNQTSPTRENSESPGLRFRPEIATFTGPEIYDDPNDTADELWRPYYSYKTKKKRNKLKYKQRRPVFHRYPEPSTYRTSVSEAHLDRTYFQNEERNLGSSVGVKHSLSRNQSPRAIYNCDICDSSFITETGLRAHIIGSHPYFCRICGKQGPSGEAPVSGDYICKSCMENGSCFDNTPRSPNPEKKYHCSYCPQRFLYLATKRSHEKKHQAENKESYRHDNKEGNTEMKDSDDLEDKNIKSESMEEEYFSSANTLEKKDADNFMSLTAYQDMSKSNINRQLSPSSDSLPSLTSSKVKHKIIKRRINVHHSMHLLSKKQVYIRDNDRDKTMLKGPKTHSQEKSSKQIRRNDSESNGAHISVHKPEKWVCKEEPFF